MKKLFVKLTPILLLMLVNSFTFAGNGQKQTTTKQEHKKENHRHCAKSSDEKIDPVIISSCTAPVSHEQQPQLSKNKKNINADAANFDVQKVVEWFKEQVEWLSQLLGIE